MLVQADVVAIRQIIFRRESIGRIDEPSGNKHQRNDRHHAAPPADSAPERRNADENDERNNRQHIARQLRAAYDRHGKHISENHRKHGQLGVQGDSRPRLRPDPATGARAATWRTPSQQSATVDGDIRRSATGG